MKLHLAIAISLLLTSLNLTASYSTTETLQNLPNGDYLYITNRLDQQIRRIAIRKKGSNIVMFWHDSDADVAQGCVKGVAKGNSINNMVFYLIEREPTRRMSGDLNDGMPLKESLDLALYNRFRSRKIPVEASRGLQLCVQFFNSF
ncbi:MAG: hypothetical protein U7127_24070 [Phormidium sp.]